MLSQEQKEEVGAVLKTMRGGGVAIYSEGVKCKHTILCLQRRGLSKFILSSRGEQHGS